MFSVANVVQLQLVNEIVKHSFTLVQDPFGNYVVQYILDLPFDGIARGLATQLKGHIPELSMQKFSSNVIEKVVRRSIFFPSKLRSWFNLEILQHHLQLFRRLFSARISHHFYKILLPIT